MLKRGWCWRESGAEAQLKQLLHTPPAEHAGVTVPAAEE